MAKDLEFPRLVYRGEPDTLGTAHDAQGTLLNSETKRVNSQDELDQAEAEGWRLTRDDGKPKAPDRGSLRIPAQTVLVDKRSGQANVDAVARAKADEAAAADTTARAQRRAAAADVDAALAANADTDRSQSEAEPARQPTDARVQQPAAGGVGRTPAPATEAAAPTQARQTAARQAKRARTGAKK